MNMGERENANVSDGYGMNKLDAMQTDRVMSRVRKATYDLLQAVEPVRAEIQEAAECDAAWERIECALTSLETILRGNQ